MTRPLALALLLVAAALPAAAQTPPPANRPIPAPAARPYPGVIRLDVDVTDLERRIINVRETIPAPAGPLTLLYPKFLPGNHAATGPIHLLAGLTLTANGQRIPWTRDADDPYAFHLDVPAGATEVVAEFQWLTQPPGAAWRTVMTPQMVNLQWEKALLYPAGHDSRNIAFVASVRMPAGWNYGVALDTETFAGAIATFKQTDLYTLVDSPIFAGANYRRIDIDPSGDDVHLNIVADEASNIAATPEQLAKYEALVQQADRLFGSRHFDRYDFLLALTDRLGGIGLEHHRSSENTHNPDHFTAWNRHAGARALLPHEFTHSWNGKFMRPHDELTPNYNVPTENSLLWVYEGQTEYWGDVLSARSGLHSKEEALVVLADLAAFYQHQPGRQWRPLQDTTNHNLLGYRVPGQWPSWMRGTGDYYGEAALIWLDADTLIRELTDDRRSLDDFARSFFSPEGSNGDWTPRPYTFEDVVAALNAVAPHDWAGFLRTRLDAAGPDARAPLDGLERGGYRLVYVETPSDLEKAINRGWGSDFQYSLGFSLAGPTNRIVNIRWGGPAFEQHIGVGWDLVAIGERAASPEALREAITAAKGGAEPIRLLIKSGDRFRAVEFAYHDGLRYPRLERIAGARDRIGDILSARPR